MKTTQEIDFKAGRINFFWRTLYSLCWIGDFIGNESVPIQLAQRRFPGLAISNAKILIYFSNEIYGSNFINQHSETVMV